MDLVALHQSIDKALAMARDKRKAVETNRVVVILVGIDKTPVQEVSRITHKSTGERQQFNLRHDGSLQILHRGQWIDHPEEIAVPRMRLG